MALPKNRGIQNAGSSLESFGSSRFVVGNSKKSGSSSWALSLNGSNIEGKYEGTNGTPRCLVLIEPDQTGNTVYKFEDLEVIGGTSISLVDDQSNPSRKESIERRNLDSSLILSWHNSSGIRQEIEFQVWNSHVEQFSYKAGDVFTASFKPSSNPSSWKVCGLLKKKAN